MGLSYVKTIVQAQGGEIKVDSVLGKGSMFTIDLPLKKNVSVIKMTIVKKMISFSSIAGTISIAQETEIILQGMIIYFSPVIADQCSNK